MFDLKQNLEDWRRQMKAQSDIPAGDLDELEDHLRETVLDLRGAGLDDEEAFMVAARRLGNPEALAGEFATANPGQRRCLRVRWMVTGALAVIALSVTSYLVADFTTGTAVWLSNESLLPVVRMRKLGLVAGLLQLVVFATGAILIWRLLNSGAIAARLQKSRFWKTGLFGAVIGAAVIGAAISALRMTSGILLSRGLPSQQFADIALITIWFRWGLALILPIALLLMLWWLARPRRPAR